MNLIPAQTNPGSAARRLLVLALLGASFVPRTFAAPASANDQPSATGTPLAWIRFTDAAQRYRDVPYRFLGDGPIDLEITVKPRPGHVLDLLWGSKNDLREAVLTVNGRDVPLRQSGYDGFRWLRMPLPGGVTGDAYRVSLRAAGEHPAFIGEIRLASTDPSESALPVPDGNPASVRVTLKGTGVSGEAFPEMRALWDREPLSAGQTPQRPEEALFRQAERNGRQAAEALYRCRRYVDGWLAHADPKSGLIPRNLRESRDLWNGRDSAADNYPFMVLTCALTDRPRFQERMRQILESEIKLTSRIDRLGDNYLFSKQGFATATPNLDQMMFDNAEYVKDGLIPLTEWLGPSPWSKRMIGILEDLWKHAPIETPFGEIPTLNFEVNGDLLQACSRVYWFTGDRKFLDWGMRLGDYYLLGTNHPTRDLRQLRLLDHGCEVVNGLSELYLAASHAAPGKRQAYREPLHAIYQSILKHGRNADGLLYSWYNPQTGQHADSLCDTWGYVYDGFYSLFLLDGVAAYRDAVRQALGNLKGRYVGAAWADKSADGFADSIEGAINLINREPVESAADWIDSQIRMMWAIQKPDGIIEGWHGDGNFARTSIMYALWKSQGVTVQPWRADVRLGAVRDGDSLLISLAADQRWSGRLVFDTPRHRLVMKLPMDYPRINQFPEWFTVDAKGRFEARQDGNPAAAVVRGGRLVDGFPVVAEPDREVRWRITPLKP